MLRNYCVLTHNCMITAERPTRFASPCNIVVNVDCKPDRAWTAKYAETQCTINMLGIIGWWNNTLRKIKVKNLFDKSRRVRIQQKWPKLAHIHKTFEKSLLELGIGSPVMQFSVSCAF